MRFGLWRGVIRGPAFAMVGLAGFGILRRRVGAIGHFYRIFLAFLNHAEERLDGGLTDPHLIEKNRSFWGLGISGRDKGGLTLIGALPSKIL